MKALSQFGVAVVVASTMVASGAESFADRIDRASVVELTGGDRPDAPSLAEYRCFETAAGVLFTKVPDLAPDLVSLINEAVANFERAFARDAPWGAVVDSSLVPSSALAELRGAGFGYILPFTYTNPATNGLAIKRELADAALMHELGHMMFVDSIWGRENIEQEPGDRTRVRGGLGLHYGGGAPDWLDEAAAIIIQGEREADSNRRQFAQALVDPDRRDAALDLARFLTSPHPGTVNEAIQQRIEEIREQIKRGELEGGSRMIMLSPEEAGAAGRTPHQAVYYPVCRVFADYMLQTANDPAVFRRIVDTLKAGGTLDEFLAERGAALGLPASEAALIEAWRDWALMQHDAT